MRRDVMEVMADELDERAADPMASFLVWDGGGRRRLDGMARGRRWDIDREHLREKRETERLLDRMRVRRWQRRNTKRLSAYRLAWARRNPDKEREYKRRQHAARKKDPKRWALWLARQARHRAKKNARAKERYRQNLEAERARARKNSAAYYARHPERREGKRRCSICRQPGHNILRCRQRLGETT